MHSQSFKCPREEKHRTMRAWQSAQLFTNPPSTLVATARTRGVRVVSTGATGLASRRTPASVSNHRVAPPFPPGDAAQVPLWALAGEEHVPVVWVHSRPSCQQQQISPYFDPTYTRTGWIGQPPVLDRHEVVTDCTCTCTCCILQRPSERRGGAPRARACAHGAGRRAAQRHAAHRHTTNRHRECTTVHSRPSSID